MEPAMLLLHVEHVLVLLSYDNLLYSQYSMYWGGYAFFSLSS